MTEPNGVPNSEPSIVVIFTKALNFGERLLELPAHQLHFEKVINGSGAWSCEIDAEELAHAEYSPANENDVQDWRFATKVNARCAWVLIDGTPIFGGLVTGRKYIMGTGKVQLSGSDFAGYLSHRLQAKDYTNYEDPEGDKWNEGPPS